MLASNVSDRAIARRLRLIWEANGARPFLLMREWVMHADDTEASAPSVVWTTGSQKNAVLQARRPVFPSCALSAKGAGFQLHKLEILREDASGVRLYRST